MNAVNGVFNDLSEPLKTQLSQARIAVVGQRTGQAIVEQGLAVDVSPSPDQQNSEGLLHCLSEFKLEGQTIFIARAQTGREFLKSQLQKLGAQVEYISAYQTSLPESCDIQQIVPALATGNLKFVLLNSHQIFTNLIQMLGQSAISLLKDKVIIVPSERIAKRIFESHGLKATVADNASDEAMIQTMLSVCRA